jgi:hypothetical protein
LATLLLSSGYTLSGVHTSSCISRRETEKRTKNKEKPTEQWLSGWLQKKTPIIEEFFEKFVMAVQRTKPHPLG